MIASQVASEVSTKSSRTSTVSKGVVVSILDQGVVSLSNFLTSVVAARTLTLDEFGIFSLFYVTLLVFLGIQNALISGPVRVFGVAKNGSQDPGYFETQCWLQLALGGLTSLLSAGMLVSGTFGSSSLGVSFPLCVFFVQLQELARTILATKLSVVSLLSLDLWTHCGRLLLLGILALTDRLTTNTLFLGIAIPSALAAGAFLFPYRSLPFGRLDLLSRSFENWAYGKWILVEALAYAVSSQLYLYLTALIIDARSAGALNAALAVLNLINVLLSGVMGFAIPVARDRLLNRNYEAWVNWLKSVGFRLIAAVLALWGVVAVLAEPLLRMTYGENYSGFAYLIEIIGFSYIFRAVNTVLVAAFRTAELPQVGFSAQFVAAVVSSLIAYPLISQFGVAGAALGFVAVQVTWTGVYVYYVIRGALSKSAVLNRVLVPEV
ncbi:MAG: hypothetical protein NDI90_13665 [Nitrospira sp. BO4]|jgi:O-antigen/teichoic acid export membrane protein|nr:hypothetical protein [Nitrospira sp. BO4]